MATLTQKHLASPVKLLNLGDSGAGKTGVLAGLATAGYELFILDFDNGTDILGELITSPEARARVHIETLTDRGMMVPGKARMTKLTPQAFTKALNLLNRWIDSETKTDFGPVAGWDTKRVLIIDSLTFMSNAALSYALSVNGHAGQNPTQPDWGDAMTLVEQTLEILYSTDIKCHVIINTHIEYQQAEGLGLLKGLPMALGKKLTPKIGRYFNFMIQTKTRGTERLILTKPDGLVELKCPLVELPSTLPATTGLATILQTWERKGKTFANLGQPAPTAPAAAVEAQPLAAKGN